MRRRLITMVALALTALMVAGVAYAQEGLIEETDGIEVTDTVDARGVLVARGEGRAVLHSAGLVRVRVSANVLIQDHAGDANILLEPADAAAGPDSDATDGAGTRLFLPNYHGKITITGSDFTVRIRGDVRRLVAKGHGTALFDGHGIWSAGVVSGTWSGVRIYYSN